ncbi:kinase [Lacticaseibacillus rhamnosus]|uniref:kinase n=1 Tax=Lacticaseibacillus rhamnosus TaxID=47715 RepID=UPI001BA659D1|nr:kinase [Lacticaseibacillus rhamnosus]QUH16719.1 kinase [Lacticaseibacillus rhamnosus]QUS95649.1 kinase [Lacticaseibacillus rhamnosus]
MKQLIILRGNSGSGKTTTAKALRKHLANSLLISQDVVRRDMLAEKDKPNSPNIELIDLIARFGFSHQQIVIVEGILSAARYGQMLKALMNTADQSLVYYFDLSFDETLRRHAHRPKAAAFGAEAMHRWFRPHDYLGVPNEHLIQADQSQDTVVSRILADLNKRNSDQARYSD